MTPKFERLYEKKYPPERYRNEVRAMVRTLQQRYGLAKREEPDDDKDQIRTVDPEQVGFAW
jgi:hypothetical protein